MRDREGRPLACLLFGSAAWKAAARDPWIGWSAEQRPRHLHLLTNHTRLPGLALGAGAASGQSSPGTVILRATLSADWQQKYGHPIYLVERFVERDRFAGTCYRAAGWVEVGRTTGAHPQRPSFPNPSASQRNLSQGAGARFSPNGSPHEAPRVGRTWWVPLRRTLGGLPDRRTGDNLPIMRWRISV